MSRPPFLALAVAASLGAAAVVAITSASALADKTVTIRSDVAEVTSMQFVMLPGGSVKAVVFGRSQYASGGFSPVEAFDVVLPPAHAISVQVNNLASGQGLTFYKTQAGL